MARVISSDRLTAEHIEFVIEAPDIAGSSEPGHLVLAGVSEGRALKLPYGIADSDRDNGTVTIVTGAGSETVTDIDVAGPFGRVRSIEPIGKVLLAADGLGVAAILPFLKAFKEKGTYTVVIAGFASKDRLYWQDRLNASSDELYIVTEDGSFGIKGSMRQTIRGVCQHAGEIDRAVLIGPLTFLGAATSVTTSLEITTRVSLCSVLADDKELLDKEDVLRDAVTRFDWNDAVDLDGQNFDADAITKQLGIQIAK